MKVLFVIEGLNTGGAERVITGLANGFANRGWEVTLLAYAHGDIPPAFAVSPLVRLALHPRISLPPVGAIGRVMRLGKATRHYLRIIRDSIRQSRPQVIIAFMDQTNVRCLIAAWGTGVPVVVSERNTPDLNPIGAAYNCARRWLYPFAASVVVQTSPVLNYFKGRARRRCRVIPNSIDLSQMEVNQGGGALNRRKQTVLAVGRLEFQKGFDMLLQAFSMIAAGHPGWNLTILGEGSARAELEQSMVGLRLQSRINMPGISRRVLSELSAAEIFVLPSRFEGFSNALVEAMAMGAACVAFDCPNGPRYLIDHRKNGVLVPSGDVPALANALAELMDNPEMRRNYGQAAMAIRDRLGSDQILAQWIDLAEEVVGGSKQSHALKHAGAGDMCE